MVDVELDQSDDWTENQDWQALADRAVGQAFAAAGCGSSARVCISICLSTNDEVQMLNAQWRDKDKPTNVLSFPMLGPDELDALSRTGERDVLLGDIILAHNVCVDEAEELGVSLADHISHLIVHGTLHLLGFDHVEDEQADRMEALEVKALASLGLANPY